jgi:ABC-type Fe3+/spermidine/putrescine transport system ATPase subunit
MRSELKQLQQATGITSIFVTHDQSESMALADRIVVMNAGRIEQVGTPVDVYERPHSRFVNEFVGVINVLQGVVAGVDGQRVRLVWGDQEVHGYVAGDMQLAPGEAAVATVRPEKLSMLIDHANGSINQWSARVVGSAYYGDHREYELDIGNQPLKISTPSSINVEKGAHVGVTCDPAEVVVIADRLG